MQVLFELDDVVHGDVGLIGQDDTHQGDCQQTTLGRQQVTQGEKADDEHERDAALQVVGDEMATHESHENGRAQQTKYDANGQRADDTQ